MPAEDSSTNSPADSSHLHLSDWQLESVRRILATQLPATEVWAFGSRAPGGQPKPFSDLDLAIVSAQPLSGTQLVAAKTAFAESDLPFRVDLVELCCVDEAFLHAVTQRHVVVQAAGDGRGAR